MDWEWFPNEKWLITQVSNTYLRRYAYFYVSLWYVFDELLKHNKNPEILCSWYQHWNTNQEKWTAGRTLKGQGALGHFMEDSGK